MLFGQENRIVFNLRRTHSGRVGDLRFFDMLHMLFFVFSVGGERNRLVSYAFL
jgi:hypothetical protein